MKKVLLYVVVLLCFITTIKAQEVNKFWLPSFFSNNMVLQQNSKVNIWGKSFPGDRIKIQASWGKTITVQVDVNGKWNASIETTKAGGPYSILFAGKKDKRLIENVLLGEVWICSGQSNMEMPLKGWPSNPIQNSATEIQHAENFNLRMFTLTKAFSIIPEEDCKGNWEVSSSETAGNFSASAYFFGKKLYDELKVPVGLIHTSWGGTPAEAWTSSDALKMYPDYAPVVNNFNGLLIESNKAKQWITNHPFVELSADKKTNPWANLLLNDIECSKSDITDTFWYEIELPNTIETVIGDFDGAVWLRKWIDIPQNWIGKDLKIKLPGIDDMDRTYFNGVLVGSTEESGFWQTPRNYAIPNTIVKAGLNLISIRVIDNSGGGGISDSKIPMELVLKSDTNQSISLAGKWKLLPTAEYLNNGFYLYNANSQEFKNRPKMSLTLNQFTPTALYNAMIQPLVPYTIKGAIWYQGESNVGRAKQYETLFHLLIDSWRKNFNQGNFPFYFVQIAPYVYSGVNNIESAELRDAQRISMQKVENSGMVVTLDIGNVNDIHPANKTDIGNRLALWALSKTYNKNIVCSGPVFKNLKIEGHKAIILFDYAETGLKAKNGKLEGFEIAGNDNKFVAANAEIKENKVVVYSDNVLNPIAVRYAFSNGAEATLFNAEGLPASSFSVVK